MDTHSATWQPYKAATPYMHPWQPGQNIWQPAQCQPTQMARQRNTSTIPVSLPRTNDAARQQLAPLLRLTTSSNSEESSQPAATTIKRACQLGR
jgi:hypothetical protein